MKKTLIVGGGGNYTTTKTAIENSLSGTTEVESIELNDVEFLQKIVSVDLNKSIDFSQPIPFINLYTRTSNEMLCNYFPNDYYIYKSKGKTKSINHNRKKSKAAKKSRKANRKN